MIPVSMYNIDKDCAGKLLISMERCSEESLAPYRIALVTDSTGEVLAFTSQSKQAAICIIGVDNLMTQSDLTGIKLSRKVLSMNRDHYVVLILKNPGNLEDVLSVCTRLAGVLCVPIATKRMDNLFKAIFKDYQCAHLGADRYNVSGFVILNEGNKVHQLLGNEILYVQALNKKVEVVLEERKLQIYANMSDIMIRLGDAFIRCHRSYIVNRKRVKQIDWTEMYVLLDNGAQIPVSRSYRAELKKAF